MLSDSALDGPMRFAKESLAVAPRQRKLLQQWSRAHGTPQQVAQRCRIMLLNDAGWSDRRIAKELGLSRHTCRLWRRRFAKKGPDSLWEIAEGRGRKPQAGLAQRIIEATLHTKPQGQTHWSTRSLAKRYEVHASTVCRIWQEHEIQPHRQETFKLPRAPDFVPKLLDVVGVYLNRTQNAIVLCVDEKGQIQAVDRAQPKPGRCGTWTHDCVRNGTITLFAALETVRDKVVGQCYPRHRHQDLLKFLNQLEVEYPGELELHLVMDNYGRHKHSRLVRWLSQHRRFKTHFIPTSSSWLNLVERWFAELTGKAVRPGSFASVPDLIEAIFGFIEQGNKGGKAFVWTAKAKAILEKLERCRVRLEQIKPGCTSW